MASNPAEQVKKLHLSPKEMQEAVRRAANDVKTLPAWKDPKAPVSQKPKTT